MYRFPRGCDPDRVVSGAVVRQTDRYATNVTADVLEDFATGEESFAVIVHLWAPPRAVAELSPRSDVGDRARIETNRPLVVEVTDRLRSSLEPSDIERVRPFLLQPGFPRWSLDRDW